MHQNDHAQRMTDRFRELVEQSGDTLPVNHYDELRLIIEAGLDTALVETMEKIADKLVKMSQEIKHNATYFD